MTKYIGWIFSIIFFFVTFKVEAQSRKKEISIGDTVPNVEIKNIINGLSDSVKISDFKGKLLIIDFWATWCTSCIASFPKLDSLQKKYSEQLTILPVTYEDKSLVTDFLDKMNRVIHLRPVTATNDKVLSKLFRHSYLPHYVWISNNQVVLGITEGKEVNGHNIDMILENKKPSLTIKKDALRDIVNESKDGKELPVFAAAVKIKKENGTGYRDIPDSNLMIHTALTGYIDGLPVGAKWDSSLISVWNNNIAGLYSMAFFNRTKKFNVKINVADSFLYEKISGNINGRPLTGLQALAWLRENGYCYEIKVPIKLMDQKYDFMLDELNRFFGLKYGIEGVVDTVKQKYLSLIRIGSEDKMASKGGGASVRKDKFSLKIKNENLNILINNLIQPLQLYSSILDDTKYTGKVDIELNCLLSDLNELNFQLEKYGLELKQSEKPIQIGVLRDKSPKGLR